jgi:hypothetical protein
MDVIKVTALSRFSKSRIGKAPQLAIVEQRCSGQLFVVFPHNSYCRWIPIAGDSHWKTEPMSPNNISPENQAEAQIYDAVDYLHSKGFDRVAAILDIRRLECDSLQEMKDLAYEARVEVLKAKNSIRDLRPPDSEDDFDPPLF